eukprot:116755_1
MDYKNQDGAPNQETPTEKGAPYQETPDGEGATNQDIPTEDGAPNQDTPTVTEVLTTMTVGARIDFPMTLNSVRDTLIRLEESIIFAFIERSQFRLNSVVYEAKHWEIPDWDGDFADYFLTETEKLCSKTRRYTSPDEYPFSPLSSLPSPVLPSAKYPKTIVQDGNNVNAKIREYYRSSILPSICESGDDGNYGSSAVRDVNCLQELSKRIHYGKFVAETKFCQEPSRFAEIVKSKDREARLMEEITDSKVEERVLERIRSKVKNYISHMSSANHRLDPETVTAIYRDFVIPLTKDVQVTYLCNRVR